MKITEAREFVAMMEELIGHEAKLPTAVADQATASFRDDLRELGVDSDDPQQMLGVFAGVLVAYGAMAGSPVPFPVVHKLTHVLRLVADWQGAGTGASTLIPPVARRRRWKLWRR